MSLNSLEVTFTRIPNIIIDKYLPGLQGSEIAILIVIIRKTIGFHKPSDKIALSTFEKLGGQARSTVIKALNELIKKGLIIKSSNTSPITYSINSELLERETNNTKIVVRNSNRSMIIEPEMGGFSNQQLVRNSNTQKNTIKKKKETTTSSTVLSDNVLKVVEEWNKRFETKVLESNLKIIENIGLILKRFSISQIITAMENRLTSDYYTFNKPELLHRPSAFFLYPETIENDLKRKPKGILTYDEMINKVTSSPGLTTENFSKVNNVLDDSSKPMWKLNS